MSQALFVNYIYLLLDFVMIALGLLFVWKWGKRGLLAITLWLFVIGLMALTAGDALATLSENYGQNFVLNEGGYYEVSSKDFAYIPAVIIWIIAFLIPIKFAFIDAKKQPRGEEPPEAPPPGQGPPQPQAQGPMTQPPAQAPPPPPMQAPPPPPIRAPPPPHMQAPPGAPPQAPPPMPPQTGGPIPPPMYQQPPRR